MDQQGCVWWVHVGRSQIINVGCPQMDNKWLGVWFVPWINDEKCPFLANINMKCTGYLPLIYIKLKLPTV